MSPFSEWLADLGLMGWVLGLGITVLVAVVPVPAELAAVANAAAFGPVAGCAITWLGAVIGAQLSYEAGLHLRGRIATRVAGKVLDRFGGGGSPWLLLVARLLPFVAFHALNWGAGLVQIGRGTFLWTTAVGIIPGTIAFTLTGSGALTLYRRHPTWTLAAGLLILGANVFYRVRRRNTERRGLGAVPRSGDAADTAPSGVSHAAPGETAQPPP